MGKEEAVPWDSCTDFIPLHSSLFPPVTHARGDCGVATYDQTSRVHMTGIALSDLPVRGTVATCARGGDSDSDCSPPFDPRLDSPGVVKKPNPDSGPVVLRSPARQSLFPYQSRERDRMSQPRLPISRCLLICFKKKKKEMEKLVEQESLSILALFGFHYCFRPL